MKVLIISRGYPTNKYKMNGIFEFDQAKALAEAGIDVIYAAIDVRSIRRWRKWGYESFNKDRVQIEAINVPGGIIPQKLLYKIKKMALKKLYKRIIKKYGKPDLIHSHYINMGYVTANLFSNSRIPLIHTEHYSGMNKENLSEHYQYLGNNTYKNVDKVISVSKALADNLSFKFNIDSILIPNIVDTSSFHYSQSLKKFDKQNGEFNFISVGGLTSIKRMDLLINSFYHAFKDKKEVKLYIYGEGPQRKFVESLIDKLKMNKQVFLKGLVDRKVIASKMQESQCFVLASRSETFGVSFIEAMSTGLPVIATKCGGPEDFVNESNGILIAVDDQQMLTQALLYMYNNINKYDREKISINTIEKYSSKNIARLITKEYNNILIEQEQMKSKNRFKT